jgi:hypothetical protein
MLVHPWVFRLQRFSPRPGRLVPPDSKLPLMTFVLCIAEAAHCVAFRGVSVAEVRSQPRRFYTHQQAEPLLAVYPLQGLLPTASVSSFKNTSSYGLAYIFTHRPLRQ